MSGPWPWWLVVIGAVAAALAGALAVFLAAALALPAVALAVRAGDTVCLPAQAA